MINQVLYEVNYFSSYLGGKKDPTIMREKYHFFNRNEDVVEYLRGGGDMV